jgi:hypothetical protein
LCMKSSCSRRGSCVGADRSRHPPVDPRNPPTLRTCGRNHATTPPPNKNPGRTRVPPGLACSYLEIYSETAAQTVRRRRSTRPPRNPPTTSTAMV